MAIFYPAGKGGGADTSDVTAVASDVLKGKVIVDAEGEPVEGSMADKAGTTQSATASLDTTNSRVQLTVPASGRYTTASKLYATYATIRNLIGLTAAKILMGHTILGLAGTATSDATAAASNILKGKTAYVDGSLVTGTIESLAGGTYKSTTSNRTIACSGKYMTSNIVIEGDSDLKAANIAKGVSLLGVTGTFYGNKKAIGACAYRGFKATEYNTSEEQSFTMPANGIVYYGGFGAGYGSSIWFSCEILKNGTVVDSRNYDPSFAVRATMYNKSFTANKGDVIKVRCTATSGTHVIAGIQAVIVY